MTCVVLGVAALVFAFTPFGRDLILSLWPDVDVTFAQGFAGFAATAFTAILVLPASRRTVRAGIARAGELQKRWDAGELVSLPSSVLPVDALPARSLVVAGPRQARRIQRSLVRGAWAIGQAVVTVRPRDGESLADATATARGYYGRLIRAGRRSPWEVGRQVVYAVDLTVGPSGGTRLQEALEELQSWEELWPRRAVVLFAASPPEREPEKMHVIRLVADPHPAMKEPDFGSAAVPTGRACLWGPVAAGVTFGMLTIVLIDLPGALWDRFHPLDLPTTFLVASTTVIALCWTIWPPQALAIRLTRTVAAAIGLAVLMTWSRYLPGQEVASLPQAGWRALTETLMVAAVIVLAVRRQAWPHPVPVRAALAAAAIIATASVALTPDPMLVVVSLVGTIIVRERGQRQAVIAGLVMVEVVVIVDLALQSPNVVPMLPAATAVAALVLAVLSTRIGTIRPSRQRLAFVSSVGLGWLILWAAAPIPWVLEAASLPQGDGTIPPRLVVGAIVVSVMLGALTVLATVGADASGWVVRIAAVLPVVAGALATVTASPADNALPMVGVCVAVVLVCLPCGTRERGSGTGFVDLAKMTALVGLVAVIVGVLIPLLGNISGLTHARFIQVSFGNTHTLVEVSYGGGRDIFRPFSASQVVVAGVLLVVVAAAAWLFSLPGVRSLLAERCAHVAEFARRLGSAASRSRWIAWGTNAVIGSGLRPTDVLVVLASSALVASVQQVDGQIESRWLADLVCAFICLLAISWSWAWRHGSSDWVALLVIGATLLLGPPGGAIDPTWLIGLAAGAMFVGGPSTVLAARRIPLWADVTVCLLPILACSVVSVLLAVGWVSIDLGWGIDVPEVGLTAVLFLPFAIFRAGLSAPLSVRIDAFTRASRRFAGFATVGFVLSVVWAAVLDVAFEQSDLVSGPSPGPGQLLASVGLILLVLIGVYGWLHLGLITAALGEGRWRWKWRLQERMARAADDADQAVAHIMALVRDSGASPKQLGPCHDVEDDG
jgi:hypothetical protein